VTAQLDLELDLPAIIEPDRKPSIHERFIAFHAANPHVCRLLIQLAREMHARRKRVGIKACWERLRWEYALRTEGDDRKLNNNYTSRYARLIAGACPDLADAFETRKLRAA